MRSRPRMGAGNTNTGLSTQSEEWPSAWLVDEPSKPQTGGSWPSARILVLERSRGVGLVPSIQMYSALMLTGVVAFRGESGCGVLRQSRLATCSGLFSSVNAL